MGMFDDLTPQKSGGMFDDLAPAPKRGNFQTDYGTSERLGAMLYGGAKGFADTVQAPAQIVLNGAAGLLQNERLMGKPGPASKWVIDKADQFNEHLKGQESSYQSDTQGDKAFGAGLGRVATGVLPFILSGGAQGAPQAAQQAPGFFAGLPRAAGMGAMYSTLTQPVSNATTTRNDDGSTSSDFFEKKATQGGVGAFAGAAGSAVGSAISKALSPKIAPEVQALLDANIKPTVGQMLGGAAARTEDRMTSVPIIGDMINRARRRGVDQFNQAAYNEVLKPLGKEASQVAPVVGREGVAAVKKELSDAYNTLLPKLNFKADPQFGQEMKSLIDMSRNGNIPPAVSQQFENIMKNEVFSRMTKQGAMDGKNFKTVEEALNGKIKSFGSSVDPNQRELGNALKEALTSLRANLARSNPEQAAELAAINQAYANYARVRQAAGSTGNESGVFTPAQLQAAVRAQDKSAGKGNFATGNALMQNLSESAKNVLGSKYPDSGTAGRLMLGGLAAGGAGGGLSLAGLGAANPYLVGGGLLAMAPYTDIGQRLAIAALTKRPGWAPGAAKAAQAAGPSLGLLSYPAFANAAE